MGGDAPVAAERPILLISDQDQGAASLMLQDSLLNQATIEVVSISEDQTALQEMVMETNAAAGLFIQPGLDETLLTASDFSNVVWVSGKDGSQNWLAREIVERMLKRINVAAVLSHAQSPANTGKEPLLLFKEQMAKQAKSWQVEPVYWEINETAEKQNPYTQTAPGMMLQFAVAGLTGVAAILVLEKNGRTEARMRTCGVPVWQVLLGHFLAITAILGLQFLLLLTFGQIVLGLNYLSAWPATVLISLLSVFCIAALGLLIGVISKSEEQTVMYAMFCMFILSGLGGLWMPLEVTGAAFQTIGHLTPLAWAMDAYSAILVSGSGLAGISRSLMVLGAYTLGLLGITIVVYQRQNA
jgi:ABC-2 type transport system permease protein